MLGIKDSGKAKSLTKSRSTCFPVSDWSSSKFLNISIRHIWCWRWCFRTSAFCSLFLPARCYRFTSRSAISSGPTRFKFLSWLLQSLSLFSMAYWATLSSLKLLRLWFGIDSSCSSSWSNWHYMCVSMRLISAILAICKSIRYFCWKHLSSWLWFAGFSETPEILPFSSLHMLSDYFWLSSPSSIFLLWSLACCLFS